MNMASRPAISPQPITFELVPDHVQACFSMSLPNNTHQHAHWILEVDCDPQQYFTHTQSAVSHTDSTERDRETQFTHSTLGILGLLDALAQR